jgi:transcription-repair coupling factor (superfamily II helicase)
MNLDQLVPELQKLADFEAVRSRLLGDAGHPAALSVADAAKPYVLAALHAALDRPLLLITARPSQARFLREEIACWHPHPSGVLLFPEQDVLPFEPLPADQQTTAERLSVMTRLIESKVQGPRSKVKGDSTLDVGPWTLDSPFVIACARAAADLLAAPADFERASSRLRVGERARPETLIQRWLELGYEPAPVVDSPGQFGRRGGILDVYPLVGEPCRIEFFGDEVESLRTFDPLTQRSATKVDEVPITPASAGPPSLPFPPSSGGRVGMGGPELSRATLLDYLPPDGVLALDERHAIANVAREFDRQVAGLRDDLVARGELDPDATAPYLEWQQLAPRLEGRAGPRLELEHDPEAETFPFVHPPAFGGRLRHFLDECRRHVAAGQRVVVVTQQAQRIGEQLADAEGETARRRDGERQASVSPSRRLSISPSLVQGQLQTGWQSEALRTTVFTDNEIFGWHKIHRPSRPRRLAGRQTFLAELTPGELVVHVDHGIARYRGMVRMSGESQDSRARASANGTEREYLLLEYAAGDRLYVPADQADRVTRYVGAGEAAPTITRLGSGEWARAKTRVRRAVREIAQDLLELYATREQADGTAFPPDTAWQTELEASFPYVETPDQLKALDEVKQDMERPKPMDRLLVGDVGYGKTEVALRAAFKAVEAGKQVAILVPTTVLAQQHWNTFRERLAAFPIKVEMLSRFRSDREQREVVRGLAEGSVDICIGTHRLLQKDVSFKDLGLVIIDEEQRFGVANKERLKQLRREVDVLTLTATPIPRTLHMSLVGVRDMSTMETPPEERLPIRTFVTEYDEGLIREAILRELDRGGQVYFVHNRVQSIAYQARRLQKLVPEARIAIGHGQMPEEQLERVMLEFAGGEHDVLVCTTIIESGLDIQSVNTLIVNNAHHFGLSQLYQLRGRVGRGAARAYAYFLFIRDTALTETAERRLRTIFEATELGAGFRIALKDLEIRGAGNLLGAEQHGHISAVGFDLYTRLLAEVVGQLKEARALVSATTDLSASSGQAGRPTTKPPLPLGEGRGEGGRRPPIVGQLPAPSVSLPVSAYLPADYVEDEPTRLNFYQRLAGVTSGEQLAELIGELTDRFGPLPEAVQNLAYVISLRLAAQRAGVQQVQSLDHEVIVKFERLPRLDVSRLARIVGVPLRAGSNQLRLPRGGGQDWMVQLQTLVESLPAASP